MNKLRLGAAAITLLGVLAAKPPLPYIDAANAAPGIVRRPCTALKYAPNGPAGTARAVVGHYCAVSYRVSFNPYDTGGMPGEFLIEGAGQFRITNAPRQQISYSWTLTRNDGHGGVPVKNGTGSCWGYVTSCPWGTKPIRDIGWGNYTFYVQVKFGKEPNVRYWRAVTFDLADAAWPTHQWN